MGTSGYHFDDWIGTFNPPRVSASRLGDLPLQAREDQDRLLYYQKYFGFLEINNTFYPEPSLTYFEDLEKRSRNSIKYSVKVSREIFHSKSRNSAKSREMMLRYVNAVSPLVESGRFYSFLLQLEDRHRKSPESLEYILDVSSYAVRSGCDIHIEFRHRSWHEKDVLQALKDNGIGICNTEIPAVPHAFPLKAYTTTSKGYMRYSGKNLENWYPDKEQTTTRDQIESRNACYDYIYSPDEVSERVHGQIALRQKATGVAVAYNNHYNAQAVLNGIQNLKILNQRLLLDVDSASPRSSNPSNYKTRQTLE